MVDRHTLYMWGYLGPCTVIRTHSAPKHTGAQVSSEYPAAVLCVDTRQDTQAALPLIPSGCSCVPCPEVEMGQARARHVTSCPQPVSSVYCLGGSSWVPGQHPSLPFLPSPIWRWRYCLSHTALSAPRQPACLAAYLPGFGLRLARLEGWVPVSDCGEVAGGKGWLMG